MKLPLSREQADREAWRRVCEIFAKVESGAEDVNELLCIIGECVVLFGDPNVPPPKGVIRADV